VNDHTALAIRAVGLVTSVGLSAPAACAAIRAKLTNPCETHYVDSAGEWIRAHEVPLDGPWRGLGRLARMGAMAVEECLDQVPREEWQQIPVFLCVAEQDRPGRLQALDEQLLGEIQELLGARFGPSSAIVPHGRAAVAVALMQARNLIKQQRVARVLIVAADSLLKWETLSHYERNDRLLTKRNSNGFMPGEGAGALLVTEPTGSAELLCVGLGFGMEAAHIDSSEPLRADGLTSAIKAALADGGCEMHEMEYRIADISGEHYYFLEASLAVSRVLRRRKRGFDIWHPAECTGEAGAVAGVSVIAVADAACRKGYSRGRDILAHMSNDNGRRAAVTLHFTGA
jgi:3-oxoacyl-[acyl-carrier-protein] synthase I